MMLPNGDHYDEDLGAFYSTINVKKEEAVHLFKPYWDEYKRTVIDDVSFLKPDVYEFLTVSGLILWDTGGCFNSYISNQRWHFPGNRKFKS